METDGGMLVFWILAPLFLAVGLYLLWYTRRRKRLLQNFARTNHLHWERRATDSWERDLAKAFALEEAGLLRRFDRVRDLVSGEGITLFRAVELLDLNPHGQAYNTHFPRIAATFAAPAANAEFFLLEPSLAAHNRHPGEKQIDAAVLATCRRVVSAVRPRHTLSVSLARGRALLYFEPLVTGGETREDIEQLHRIARTLAGELR